MYAVPSDHWIEQGDVIDACPLPVFADSESFAAGTNLSIPAARVVVVTQTCDLVQGKASRAVVAVCHSAQLLVDRQILKSASVRDQIRSGKTYGWYFLPASEDFGLPETLVDMRDLHTVPVPILLRLVEEGKRRVRILSPYREHLAQHFAVTYMRIALPLPYETRA